MPLPCGAARPRLDHKGETQIHPTTMKRLQNPLSDKIYVRKNVHLPLPPSPNRPIPCQLLAGQLEGIQSTIVTICLEGSGKRELLGSLAFMRGEGIELGTILHVVLSSICMMLIVSLFVWPISNSLSHL